MPWGFIDLALFILALIFGFYLGSVHQQRRHRRQRILDRLWNL